MKFIFDFDGVLFSTTKFREKIFLTFESFGISHDLVTEYLHRERWNLFSLRKMLDHFSLSENEYEEIMKKCKNFINCDLLAVLKKINKQECFIATYGDKYFQEDKIKRTGISKFFREIMIVQGSKKEAVEKICAKYQEEIIVFVDDQVCHFEDLDYKKYPNLKTILYDEQGLKKLKAIISHS